MARTARCVEHDYNCRSGLRLTFCRYCTKEDEVWCGRAQQWHRSKSSKNWYCPQCSLGYSDQMLLALGTEDDWKCVDIRCKERINGKFRHRRVTAADSGSASATLPRSERAALSAAAAESRSASSASAAPPDPNQAALQPDSGSPRSQASSNNINPGSYPQPRLDPPPPPPRFASLAPAAPPLAIPVAPGRVDNMLRSVEQMQDQLDSLADSLPSLVRAAVVQGIHHMDQTVVRNVTHQTGMQLAITDMQVTIQDMQVTIMDTNARMIAVQNQCEMMSRERG